MGERDNQQKDPAKHHSSLASQASLSGREESGSSVPVGRADSRLHARVASSFCQKRRCSFRCSVLSLLSRFLGAFFSASCSAAQHKATQRVYST